MRVTTQQTYVSMTQSFNWRRTKTDYFLPLREVTVAANHP